MNVICEFIECVNNDKKRCALHTIHISWDCECEDFEEGEE